MSDDGGNDVDENATHVDESSVQRGRFEMVKGTLPIVGVA